MKFNISYRNQFIISLVWIFIVAAVFSTVSNIYVAAIVSSCGFLLIPSLFLVSELQEEEINSLHISILSLFVFICALPVFYLRVSNWAVDFTTLKVFNIFPAQEYYNLTKFFYVGIVASALFSWIKKIE